MAKVVKLQQPMSPTVELAEKLLADCKSGKVIGFAYAAVVEGLGDGTNQYTCSASAFLTDADLLDRKLMICAIEEMRHEFMHAQRGG